MSDFACVLMKTWFRSWCFNN